MALFIKFDGVQGECQDANDNCCSDLQSMSWGLIQAGSGATGQTRLPWCGDGARCTDYNKEFDSIQLVKLAEAVASGKVFPKGGDSQYGQLQRRPPCNLPQIRTEERDGHLAHGQRCRAGGDAVPPGQAMSLNFEEVKQTYTRVRLRRGAKKGMWK